MQLNGTYLAVMKIFWQQRHSNRENPNYFVPSTNGGQKNSTVNKLFANTE
ncbi:hypothetical protein [Nostoc sp. PA-18-2419]|nr:hypothetical protein [Nostoc sp. PA-18-2419]